MRQTKREIFLFSAIDCFSLKEHFEKMARKGWFLEKIGIFTAKYRRIEPEDLIFSVDVYPELKLYQNIDKEDLKSYINLCQDAGWKFITSYNNLQIFYSRKEDNLIPVQTDEEIKAKIIEESILVNLFSLFLSLLVLFNSLKRLIPFDYKNLYSNMDIVFPIFISIFVFYAFIYIFSYLLWFIRARINIRKNKPLPKTNYTLAKIKGTVFFVIFIMSAVAVIISIIADSIIKSMPMFLIIIPIVLIPVLSIIYHKKIKPRNIGKFKEIGILAATIIILTMIPIHGIGSFYPKDYNNSLEPGYIGFSTQDFNIDKIPARISFRKEGSFLIPKRSIYNEYYNNGKVGTIYIKGINNKVTEYIFDGIIKEAVEFNRTITPAGGEYDYFNKAYYINSPSLNRSYKDEVILLKDKEIIYLDSDIDLSDEKNIEIIISKLGN